MIQQGQAIFVENCAMCHQETGVGDPPTFPALAGNPNLGDLGKIVTNIHQGQGNMPPFPDLTAEEVAAVATYIRRAGGTPLAGSRPRRSRRYLRASRPEWSRSACGTASTRRLRPSEAWRPTRAPAACATGRRLNGAPDDNDMKSSPPLARSPFLREWDGKSLATLFEFTRATMPQNNPGYMPEQEYIDIIAHMLSMSDIPAGDDELPPDPQALAQIVITPGE